MPGAEFMERHGQLSAESDALAAAGASAFSPGRANIPWLPYPHPIIDALQNKGVIPPSSDISKQLLEPQRLIAYIPFLRTYGVVFGLLAGRNRLAKIVKERIAPTLPLCGTGEGHQYTQRPNSKPTAKRRAVKITKVQVW